MGSMGPRWLAALLLGLTLGAFAAAQEPSGASDDPAAGQQDPAERPTLEPEEIEQLAEEASRAEASQIAGQDAALSERLRSIFAALEGLERLRVEVRAGIVVLSGTAPTRPAADRAAEMARAVEGVVLVVDEIQVEKSMLRRLATSWELAKGQLRSAVASLPLFAMALAIFAAGWVLAHLLRDATFLYRFVSDRLLLQNLLRQTVFVAVLLGGLMLALRFLDAGALLSTALGAAGVVGLALGFAFRSIVENYLAGILLAIRQPFSVRDDVNIDGAVGTVLRMTTSETMLMDADGNHLRIPNAMVFNGKVVNYTRNPLRRFTVAVGVGTEVDLGRAQSLGVETLRRMKGVVDDPAPSARVTALGDSTVQLELYGWVDQRKTSYLKAASEARRLVKAAFDQAGIAMPEPAYVVRLEADGAGTALRGVAPGTAQRDAPRTDSGPPPEGIDLSAADDVSKQVEQEIARSDEENLLSEPGEAGPA